MTGKLTELRPRRQRCGKRDGSSLGPAAVRNHLAARSEKTPGIVQDRNNTFAGPDCANQFGNANVDLFRQIDAARVAVHDHQTVSGPQFLCELASLGVSTIEHLDGIDAASTSFQAQTREREVRTGTDIDYGLAAHRAFDGGAIRARAHAVVRHRLVEELIVNKVLAD